MIFHIIVLILWNGELGLRSFRGFLGRIAFRKFPIKHVKEDLVFPHIFLVLYVYGCDVKDFDTVYRCSSCGVVVLSVLFLCQVIIILNNKVCYQDNIDTI
jgi:hypothetical protein